MHRQLFVEQQLQHLARYHTTWYAIIICVRVLARAHAHVRVHVCAYVLFLMCMHVFQHGKRLFALGEEAPCDRTYGRTHTRTHSTYTYTHVYAHMNLHVDILRAMISIES